MRSNRRFQLFLSSTYLALMFGTSAFSRPARSLVGTQFHLLLIAVPDTLCPHFLPLCRICTVSKFCCPSAAVSELWSSRPFGLSAPITTAINRRWPSTADAIRLKPAPEVCPFSNPSTFMVLSQSRPLRFCWVIPFGQALFAVHMVKLRLAVNDGREGTAGS